MLEIYTTIKLENGNHNAYFRCGPVINCDFSPCGYQFKENVEYYCRPHRENLYEVLEPGTGNGLFQTGMTLLIFGFLFSIWAIVDITCHLIVKYQSKEYEMIDTEE